MDAKAAEYVRKHNVFQLFGELLQQLILHKPDDPMDYLINYLGNPHGPKIVFHCPADVPDQQFYVDLIQARYGVLVIDPIALIKKECDSDSEIGALARRYVASQKDDHIVSDAPEELVVELVKQRIQTQEAKHKGVLLLNFPQTRRQALALQALGILPDKCIFLERDEVAQHFQQYFQSPATSPAPAYTSPYTSPYSSPLPSPLPVRSPQANTPTDVDRALYHYYKHLPGVAECFKNAHKKFNVEHATKEHVVEEMKEFLDAPVSQATA